MGIYIESEQKSDNCRRCSLVTMKSCPIKDYTEWVFYKDSVHPNCPITDTPKAEDKITERTRQRYIRLLESRKDLSEVNFTKDAVRELLEVLKEGERFTR